MRSFAASDIERGPDNACSAEEPMASPLPTFDLQELIGAGKRAIIRHRGRRYLLTLTRRDRLILTLEEPRADGDEKA